MKKSLIVIEIIISALTAEVSAAANQKKSASDIFKNYSGIVCNIFVDLEVTGENYFKEPKQTKTYTSGSCFAVELNGKKIIVTAAHIAKPENEDQLGKINREEIQKSTIPINLRLKDVWKTVSEVKFSRAKVIFKKPGTSYSLKNAAMDLDSPEDSDINLNFASADTAQKWLVMEATLEKFNQNLDLASLQLKDESWYQHLQFGKFGNSNKLKLGESVHVIGNPIGHNLTILSGQVAHFHIEEKGNLIRKFIYTSEMLDYGSSGSPLFNDNGEIIGIAIELSLNRLSFGIFIPSNTVKKFLKSN